MKRACRTPILNCSRSAKLAEFDLKAGLEPRQRSGEDALLSPAAAIRPIGPRWLAMDAGQEAFWSFPALRWTTLQEQFVHARRRDLHDVLTGD
jgi:hypothetical protein